MITTNRKEPMNEKVILLHHISKTVTDEIELEVNRQFDPSELRQIIDIINHRLTTLKRSIERLKKEEERHLQLLQAATEELEEKKLPDSQSTRLEDVRLNAINDALMNSGYNRTRAATALGIKRTSLLRMIEKMELSGYRIPKNRSGRPA